jgi:eukaryotic-like serine/threonine-protein kinase
MAKRAMSSPPVIPGHTYIRPLGSGGFADVFLYEQDMPRRVVAVKVLASDAISPDVLRTFNAEADIMARLSAHPSIVTIHQASISADGRPFFVMEYCPDTMSTRYKKAPLPVADVLDAGVRMAAALETAHRSGLLHRDIKPSNVLITSLNTPVLADFGIASAIVDDEDESRVFAMSVPWSSPEVLAERVSGSVTSEVWSLGATLYTLLAGRSPFESELKEKNSRDMIKARVAKAVFTPIPRDDVSPKVHEVLAKAMDKNPARRQQSMFDFAEELRWAQFDLGLPPTALEVAAPEWAAAAAPVDFADTATRGPVVTTVNQNSRRADRARQLADLERKGRQAPAATSAPSPMRSALIGAGIAIGAVVVIGVIVLVVIGAA